MSLLKLSDFPDIRKYRVNSQINDDDLLEVSINTNGGLYSSYSLSMGYIKNGIFQTADTITSQQIFDINYSSCVETPKLAEIWDDDIFVGPIYSSWPLFIDSTKDIPSLNRSAPNWVNKAYINEYHTPLSSLYPDFWTKLINLVSTSGISYEYCTSDLESTYLSSNYMQDVNNYGHTGRFLIDLRGYVALPILNDSFLGVPSASSLIFSSKDDNFPEHHHHLSYTTNVSGNSEWIRRLYRYGNYYNGYYYGPGILHRPWDPEDPEFYSPYELLQRPTILGNISTNWNIFQHHWVTSSISMTAGISDFDEELPDETAPKNISVSMYMVIANNLDTNIFTAINNTDIDTIPIGTIQGFALSGIPDNTWLIGNGQTVNTIDYPVLAYMLGETGETFNIPNIIDKYLTSDASTESIEISTNIDQLIKHRHGNGRSSSDDHHYYFINRNWTSDFSYYMRYDTFDYYDKYIASSNSGNMYTSYNINNIDIAGLYFLDTAYILPCIKAK